MTILDVLSQASRPTKINTAILGVFLVIVTIFGGASRSDVLSLPVVYLASIATILVAALQMDRHQLFEVRIPLTFLGMIAAVIGLQLIPLPADWWAALPGHAHFAEGLSTAGIPPVWRPASMTPDLTLGSLLALLVPLAVIMILGVVDRTLHVLLLPLLLAAVTVNALVGLVQTSGGGPYFYSITNEGSAVGFFANRNHLALFVATALPLVACWAALPHPDPAYRRLRHWLYLCMVAAVFPLILTTGSRAGLIIALAGIPTMLGFPKGGGAREARGRWLTRWRIWGIPMVVGGGAVCATLFLSRGVALQRLMSGETSGGRTDNLPTYLRMIRDFFPEGAGVGSFDPIYRIYEPVSSLSPFYLNQAHNDFVQIAIEAGAPAMLLLVLFLGWVCMRVNEIWRRRSSSPAQNLARAGSIVTAMILMSSVVDYPLRTPVMAAILAIACCWMLPVLGSRAAPRPDGGVGIAAAMR